MSPRLATALVVALLGACSGAEIVDGPVVGVAIYGFVTGPEEAGVAGVSVVVGEGPQGICKPTTVGRDSVLTDASGHYHATLGYWGRPHMICVNARIASSGYAADSVQMKSVPMDYDPDSVRIDFQLRPNP